MKTMEENGLKKGLKQIVDEANTTKALSNEHAIRLTDRLLQAVKVAGIGIWEYSLQEQKFIADDFLLSLYGITPADFVGTYDSWLQYIHPKDKDGVNQKFRNAIVTLTDFDIEYRVVWPDGSVHYINGVAVVQRDSAGNPSHFTGTNQDITKSKKAELVIRESEAKYHSFFESSIDGILLTAMDGNIIAANPAACAIFQMTEAEICKVGRAGIVDVTDRRLELFLQERSFSGKAKGEITHLRKDGTKFPGEVTSVVFTDAYGEARASMIIRDISERKQAEQKINNTAKALQQALNDLKKIMDSSLDVICAVNREGQFVNVSAAAARMWGYTLPELLDKTYLELVVNEDAKKTTKTAAGILNGVQVTAFENRFVHKNGSMVLLLWSAKWDDKDKLAYCVAKDITGRKKLEQALESERHRFYDLFLQAPLAIGILKGPDHVYVLGNNRYLKLIGKSNILGKTVKEVLPEVVPQGFIEILDQVYKTGNSFSANEMLVYLDLKGDGQLTAFYLNILYQAYKSDEGNIEGVFFFTVDVTEQVAARKKIDQSEKRFRRIVETAQEGIWTVDENNKTDFVNGKTCEMLGYTVDEIMGNAIQDYMDEKERSNSYMQIERRKKGVSGKRDLKFITKSGEQLWTNISASPILDSNGKYKGALAMITDITERKKTENENLFKAELLKNIGQAVMATDPAGNILYWNKAAELIFGWTAAEAIGSHILNHGPSRQTTGLAADIFTELHKGNSWSGEMEMQRKDGTTFLALLTDSPVYDANNKMTGIIGVASDITERKAAELILLRQREQLQKANAQQAAILNALPPQIALLDSKGVIFAVNDAWKNFGIENGIGEGYVWIGQNYIEASENTTGGGSYYAKQIATSIKDIISGRTRQFSIEYPCHSPSVKRWFRAVISPLMNKVDEGAVVLHIDTTERKLAEEKLQEMQEQLIASQRMAHIGSWHRNIADITDIKSSPVICSEEALRIMGFAPGFGEMSYEKFVAIVHPEDVEMVKEAALTMFQELSSYYQIDHRIILPDGTVRWVSRDAKYINDEITGQPLKIIGTIKDITVAKEQELLLQKNTEEREMLITELTKSVKDLQQFTYITSHNFRAPLTNLIGLVNLVDFSTLSESNKNIIEMFKTSTLQLNKTINDLISILIIKNNVNVDIAENHISELLDEIGNTLSYELAETGCIINRYLQVETIYFNKSYLESILVNLLSNAIKYRSPGRLLQINISTEAKPNGDVLMVIRDNGIGIDMKRHNKKIFGLYQRFHTNADSIGLGLFIVKSQIVALGGNIEVESEVDKGTAFCITFRQKRLT